VGYFYIKKSPLEFKKKKKIFFFVANFKGFFVFIFSGTITHSPIGSYVHNRLFFVKFHNTVESPCISS
jgi:hypothetical protein